MENPALVVVAPNGHRTRVEMRTTPFNIGRQGGNDLVLRDSRTSRHHARIVKEADEYYVEDNGSRHGVFVNGRRVERSRLRASDVIEFGVNDSYQVVFTPEGAELSRLVESVPTKGETAADGLGANLGRLKAVLEIARTLQTSYSLQDVLNSVVDAALTVTAAERGFLLLDNGGELEIRCSRDSQCHPLAADALRVPKRVIHQALQSRRELLSMSFQPPGTDASASESVQDLELRSVVCVPLIRMHGANSESQTAGLIYMDSRFSARDMAIGDRELLQTLAVEASVIIENARLLEEEREKRKLDEELRVARGIQQSLLPRTLPQEGWFRAVGSSTASLQVGGDYFDVIPIDERCWAALVADVSGKGVSSALVASLLQGAFFNPASSAGEMEQQMARINRFLCHRLEAGKYATVFFVAVDRGGAARYVNAGHCTPLLVSRSGASTYFETTGTPVGMFEEAAFTVEQIDLKDGDKVVIYSDGVTEAQDAAGNFFGRPRLRQIVEASAASSAQELHAAVLERVTAFTEGVQQSDDVTLLVLEYCTAGDLVAGPSS